MSYRTSRLHRPPSPFAALLLLITLVLAPACADAEPSPERTDGVRTVSDTGADARDAAAGDAGGDAATAAGASPDVAMAGSPGDDPHAAYERLQEALTRYERLAEEGLPGVPDGDLLEVGDSSARVVAVRERLAATGDLDGVDARSPVYTEALADAVRGFQRRRGLTVDGLVGGNTLAALNTPASTLVDKIEASLDRWRELPDTLGERYVFVNVPEFKLRAFEGGEEVLEMKVVVGKQYDDRATPLFSDEMEHVIFGPYWNIPHSIATEEIVPEAREDLDYLAENNYEIVSHYAVDAEVYEPTRANLEEVAEGDLRLRQRPGPENALGRVKFIFPNEYAVYLHDTPAVGLFDEAARAFSHGCIRVEQPVDLAEWVLQSQPEWTRERIERNMNNGERTKVLLDENIPVYILYWTAYADDDGTVHFREDLYDRVART